MTITLGMFAALFLAFLLAPLALLGVALLAYLVVRPREDRQQSSGPASGSGVSNHGFGAGAR